MRATQSKDEIEELKSILLEENESLTIYQAYNIACKIYNNQYLFEIRNHLTQQDEIEDEERRMELLKENTF